MKKIEYRVQSGDSLASIARRHNIPEDVLSGLNGISDLNSIRPGQVLQILQEEQSTRLALTQTRTDRVLANDTLSKVAQRNKVTVEALAKANGISDLNQKPVFGLKLKIPPVSGAGTAKERQATEGDEGKLAPLQKKTGEQAEEARFEKVSALGQQGRPVGDTRLLVASSSPFIVANLFAGGGGGQPTPPEQTVRYPIKVPQGMKTEEELDQYAEVLIFGRVVGIRWKKMGWNVPAFAQQGKIVHYLYNSSDVERFGGREVSKVVRPSAQNSAYEGAQGSKKRALNKEINRRYWAGTGLPQGQSIKKGEQGKEDMWNFYRDEVMKDHQRLKDLPPKLKALMGGEAGFDPVDYERLLRIAEKLEQFSPEDLALFKAVAVLTTHDLDLFERSVDLFLARKKALQQAQQAQGTTPETMQAAVDESWDGVDLSKIGKMSRVDQYLLAQRQACKTVVAQLEYMGRHPGETVVDFAKTAALMNTSETFSAIGEDLAEAADGDANSWARWAAGFGAGAKLSGWLLAVAGVLFVLSWLTGVGELATLFALMGHLLIASMALSFVESELRMVAASQAKTPAEFKGQVNKGANSRLGWVLMGAMLGFAKGVHCLAKTYFPQAVKNVQTSLARLRERVRIVGKLADKKAEIVAEMKRHRGRLEQEGKVAKDAATAQADVIEAMTLDEFIAKLESGALWPEAKPHEGQKLDWKQIAETPKGRESIEVLRQRFVNDLRSEVLNEIDALVKEQTDAIDVTLDEVAKATTPEELSNTLAEHESFLRDEEVAARAKVREQRVLQRAAEAEDALGFKDSPPPELRTLAERLRRAITETEPGAIKAERMEVIQELRNPHGARRPPTYEGYVFDKILAENQAAFARSRAALHSINPDVIVGMERGGSFLTEVLTHGDPVLAAKVRKMQVHKAPEGQPGSQGKFNNAKMKAEFQALITGKVQEIVVYDAYMGGTTARSLIKHVFTPLLENNPGVTFHLYWLRETFGFRGIEVVGMKKVSPRIKTTVEEVTLVLGDDMDVVMNPGSQAPIRIFNSEGKVTEVVPPKPGQTTRQLTIEILNRPSSPAKPPGGNGLPVVPAPPNPRRKDN